MGEPEVHTIDLESVVEVRNLAKREIDVRLMPWGQVIETIDGRETFVRGAFDDNEPSQVRLMGLEHEAQIGIGQDGRPVLRRVPVGKAIALDNRDDAQYATYRVAKTARGDEVLELAAEGLVTGVSVEFAEVPGGTVIDSRSGRRTKTHHRVRLTGASTTYQPAYQGAEVIAVRSERSPEVAETTTQPEAAQAAPPFDQEAITSSVSERVSSAFDAKLKDLVEKIQTRAQPAIPEDQMQKLMDRLDKMEEQTRASFQIPSRTDQAHPDDFNRGDWLKLVLRTLGGDTVSQAELQTRVAADLITTDNLGVVPTAYLDEIIGIVDPSRPFLASTRRLRTPASGMSFAVPKIVTRPTTGVQAAEKDELTSTTTSITTQSFDPVTIGGYGDISLQLLKRSDPSYLELYLDLLAEAYAIDADDQAVDALIAAGMSQGGALDPDDGPLFGEAWGNAAAVSRRLAPDTIWLSTAGVQQFINAKQSTTNGPLYSDLAGNFTAAGGPAGRISGLRPVHVPALDDETADVIVGPSRAFVWAEDGTYTLQVDVPAKAGRDVGLVGMLWFMPLYPTAFTRYWLES